MDRSGGLGCRMCVSVHVEPPQCSYVLENISVCFFLCVYMYICVCVCIVYKLSVLGEMLLGRDLKLSVD